MSILRMRSARNSQPARLIPQAFKFNQRLSPSPTPPPCLPILTSRCWQEEAIARDPSASHIRFRPAPRLSPIRPFARERASASHGPHTSPHLSPPSTILLTRPSGAARFVRRRITHHPRYKACTFSSRETSTSTSSPKTPSNFENSNSVLSPSETLLQFQTSNLQPPLSPAPQPQKAHRLP